MNTLNYQQFTEKFGPNSDAVVINVLDEEMFRNERIPGSVNVPLESLDFLGEIEKVADKDDTVVTYCAGPECPASESAARQLEEAGYRKVYAYTGGLQEWKDVGRRVDSDVVPGDTPRAEAARTGGEIATDIKTGSGL